MKRLIPLLTVILWTSLALAAAGDISKDANKLIRSAENEYFNGKIEIATTLLHEAEDMLSQLQQEDPGHRSLKTLRTKHDRLKARIEKKLGKTQGKKSPRPAAPAGAQSAATAKKLSHGAKNNLKKADREMNFAEQELTKGQQSLQEKQFNLVESYIFNATSKVEEAGNLLQRVINSNKADPDHPEVVAGLQRHKALQQKLATFSDNAQNKEATIQQAATQAKADADTISSTWLPQITPFIDAPSPSRLQYPGSYNNQELERQEALYGQAEKVLTAVSNEVPVSQQPSALKNAVEKLRFTLQVYSDEKKADNRNRLQPIEMNLANWEKRFQHNKNWNEDSQQGLFIITPQKLKHQQDQILALAKVSPEPAEMFRKRLQALEQENTTWVEKKRSWQERPRPFPQAKMKSKKLEKEMEDLLEDRDIKVKDLVITDKDWWVQSGEFRYVTCAVLSKDKEGKYWCNVSFRQLQTLSGYGPTEVWEVDDIKIRLP